MSPQGSWAGDAWPSSVRGLNCSLKWGNERNPRCLLYMSGETAHDKAHTFLNELCSVSWEEGEDDARSACPSDILGYTRDTIAETTGRNTVKGGANPYKLGASSD